jgi:hypothetical protein
MLMPSGGAVSVKKRTHSPRNRARCMPPSMSSTGTARRLREQIGHDQLLQFISKARPVLELTR